MDGNILICINASFTTFGPSLVQRDGPYNVFYCKNIYFLSHLSRLVSCFVCPGYLCEKESGGFSAAQLAIEQASSHSLIQSEKVKE